eukprot:3036041-Pleurochrysis_carterae.AAC.3
MNAALAKALLDLLSATAALCDAGGVAEIANLCGMFDATAVYGLKLHGDDNPTWAQAVKSDEAHHWRDADARSEMQNFERHGTYVEVSEDQLPSWNASTKRAYEVIKMMWVLRKKRDEKGEILKHKARAAVVCGNQQQKRKALASSSEHTLKMFAPADRSATFRLLCTVGCLANLRVRQFDVDAAYLQGSFEANDGEVHVRPPPDERYFDDRGVPIVWKLLKPFYGEADAGRIWHRTAKKQLIEVQGLTQSKFDPCYFFKKYDNEHRVDLVLYVDDCWMADTGTMKADEDLRLFRERFKLTMQTKPKQFLGMNIDMADNGDVKISADAYIKATAEVYLPKPLTECPRFETPSSPL